MGAQSMKKFFRRNILYILILCIFMVASFSISFFSFSTSSRSISVAASNKQSLNVIDSKGTLSEAKDIVSPDKNSGQELESKNSQSITEIKLQVTTNESQISKETSNSNSDIKNGVENKSIEEKSKEEKSDNSKVAYLTFDDGPSSNITPQILDILKSHNVKATFFVIGYMVEKNPDMLKRAKNEGHAIANHTYSHDYNYVYADPQNFLNDIVKCENILKNYIPGYSNKNIRFPGGSFGANRKPFRDLIQNSGYTPIDWNCLNGDAEALNIPPGKLLQRVKDTYKNQKNLVILMHDAPSKETTVQALPQIIQFLQSQGYSFKTFE